MNQPEKPETPKQATWLTFAHLFALGLLLALTLVRLKLRMRGEGWLG